MLANIHTRKGATPSTPEDFMIRPNEDKVAMESRRTLDMLASMAVKKK